MNATDITVHPQHIAGLPALLARIMETDADKAIKFIQICWGKNLQRKPYTSLTRLDAGLVYAAIKDIGISLALSDWQDSVLPALMLLNARTLICHGCGELGILPSSPSGWQAMSEEMECPFCHKDTMLRPELEKAPINWITGQPLAPGVSEVGIERVMIPVTKEGVGDYIRRNFGDAHEVDAQFQPYPVLHVLNVLLNKGFRGIETPRDALRALVFPFQAGLLPPDVKIIISHIQRDEWLTGARGGRQPARPKLLARVMGLNAGANESPERGVDRLVTAALRHYPDNSYLLGWYSSSERLEQESLNKMPLHLIDTLAGLFDSESSAKMVCEEAGFSLARIPAMRVPMHFWSEIVRQAAYGAI